MENKILDKIKKILAKASSTDSVREAEALFQKAQELMTLHHISEEQVADTPEDKYLEHSIQCFTRRLEGQWELRLAIALCNSLNGCTFYYTSTYIAFFGEKQDVELVMYFFEVTRDTFRRLAREGYKKAETSSKKNTYIRSFLVGACDGLRSVLLDQAQQTVSKHRQLTGVDYSLIARDKLERVKQELKSRVSLKSAKSRIASSSAQGYADGVKAGRAHTLKAKPTQKAIA